MTEIRAPYAGRTLPVGTAAERDLRDEISQLRVQVKELDSFNNDLLADVARLRAGLAGLRREHMICGNCLRSCPKWIESQIGSDSTPSASCECGAAKYNAAIDALLASTA